MCFRPASVAAELKCPKCGAFVEPDDEECYECGEPLDFGAAPGAPGVSGAPAVPGAPGAPSAPGAPAAPVPPAVPGVPQR